MTNKELLEDRFNKLVEDYPEALIRIASLRADKKQYLLFAGVELYPFDMAAPSDWAAGKKPWSVPGKDGWTCAFSAVKVPTEQALEWYKAAANGLFNLVPMKDRHIPAITSSFAPEPAWGRFLVGRNAPFLLHWHDGPRLHQLVPLTQPSIQVRKLACIPQARDWLVSQLGFDPFLYDEWLGGIALIAPDPICASVSLHPNERTAEGQESLVFKLEPRKSADKTASLSTLSLHVTEARSNGYVDNIVLQVPASGFGTLQMPQLTGKVGWDLVCAERGLIRHCKPAPWLSMISSDIAMGTGKITVEVPAGGKRKPAQTYTTTQRTKLETMTVGQPVDDQARQRLSKLSYRQKERERRETKGSNQFVFGVATGKEHISKQDLDNKKCEAQDWVANLVKKARRRLIFVDPYFGPRELRLFALQNSNNTVTTRILTGFPAIKSLAGNDPGFQVQGGLVFTSELKKMQEMLHSRCPEVRIMPGHDNPAIHDRYLVVDDDVWHCGPSFNELGERLGIIVKLPNPMQIRSVIGKVWVRSRSLQELQPPNEEVDDE